MDPTETYARDGRLVALFGQPVAVPCDTPAVYATGAALFAEIREQRWRRKPPAIEGS